MQTGTTRILVLLLGLLVVLAACVPDEEAAEEALGVDDDIDDPVDDPDVDEEPDDADRTITIGLLNPVTGPFAALGEDVNDGFAFYVEQQGGSLAGYDVELVFEDEANDAAIATEAAERMVERAGADILVGFVNSGVTYAAASYIVEEGIPLIITVAGANDLTQRDAADNIFRVSYTSSSDTLPMGTYACEELGHETVSVVALDYAFGWEAAGGFARAYEDAGCDVIQETYVPLGTQDWAPFVQEIDRDADAVFALIAGPDSIRFVQAYRDFGIEAPLIGGGTLTDEEVLEQMGAIAEGIVTTLHYSAALDTDENRTFVEAFEDEHGRTVSRYVEGGYASAMILEAALTKIGGDVSFDAIIDALDDVEVDAPRGPIRFDEYGQAVYNIYVREVQEVDGVWQNTVIDTIEDVSQFWTYDAEGYMGFPRYEELKDTWSSN